jgi:phage terminase large subunit-like protein
MARRRTVPARWLRSEADEKAVAAGHWFDEAAADAVAEFAREFCRHSQGQWAGQPFELLPWQYDDVIGPLYGWRRADGTRRYRRAHIEVSKKNGKSALASMASLYHLLADGEPGAVVGNAAINREQASIVFDAAASMVRSSPELSGALDIIDSRKVIVHPASGSKYMALSADVGSKEGLNLSALICDELHRWRGGMFSTLYYAGAARRQPMQMAITTAGIYDETGVGWQQHEYAVGVLDGSIEDLSFFAYIRAADPAADWTSPRTWEAANPSLGITVTSEELGEQCAAAQHAVGLENAFRRYRLNQWTQSEERWLPLTTFDASAGHVIDEAAYVGRPFWGGTDIGAVADLAVVAELFRCPHDAEALDVILRCFLPAAALRDGPNALVYQEWARDGHLIITPGDVTDERVLVETVAADTARFGGCASMAIDRLFQAMRVSQDLAARGIEVAPCSMNTMTLSPLVDEAERRILSRTLHHGGHPILRAAVDAVEMELDAAGNRRPSRKHRARKIDALIATLLALDRVTRAPAPREPEYQVFFAGGKPAAWVNLGSHGPPRRR